MVHPSPCRRFRLGAILPFVAILLVVMIGMVAFAVDLGYVAVTRNELQNAADSAALAGAAKLLDRSALAGAPSQIDEIAAARTEAVTFAGYNKGAGVSLVLDRNDSNGEDGDIVIGYMDKPTNPNEPLIFDNYPYNTVRVHMHRDQVRNGMLDLFFAPVLGQDEQAVVAEATACVEGEIRGFRVRSTGPQTSKLLPFAVDENIWNQVVAGIGPDEWSYNPATRAYGAGSDGIKECKLYPLTNLTSGNFGTIDIGLRNNSESDIARQILNGPNQEDFDRMGGQLELGPDGTVILQGDTGVSTGFKDELEFIRGVPRIIPIFRPPVTGNGNNARFTIVKFVGVVITEVVMTGALEQRHITIQPEFVMDGTALGGGTPDTSEFVYKGIYLTR